MFTYKERVMPEALGMSTTYAGVLPSGAYRALADLFSLVPHDVSQPVGALACLPCDDRFMRRRDDEATRAVLYWLLHNQSPSLYDELTRLVGAGFCDRKLARVPACAAFYVDDPDATRGALQDLYDRCGYVPDAQFRPGCSGISYISQQLAFVAYCMETGRYQLMSFDDRLVLESSLFSWAPLFARALGGASDHPAVLFASVKLESLLAKPH
jgi:hypothetical protein